MEYRIYEIISYGMIPYWNNYHLRIENDNDFNVISILEILFEFIISNTISIILEMINSNIMEFIILKRPILLCKSKTVLLTFFTTSYLYYRVKKKKKQESVKHPRAYIVCLKELQKVEER